MTGAISNTRFSPENGFSDLSDGHDTWNIVAWRVEAGGGVLILVCGEGSCAADSLLAFNGQRLDEMTRGSAVFSRDLGPSLPEWGFGDFGIRLGCWELTPEADRIYDVMLPSRAA